MRVQQKRACVSAHLISRSCQSFKNCFKNCCSRWGLNATYLLFICVITRVEFCKESSLMWENSLGEWLFTLIPLFSHRMRFHLCCRRHLNRSAISDSFLKPSFSLLFLDWLISSPVLSRPPVTSPTDLPFPLLFLVRVFLSV